MCYSENDKYFAYKAKVRLFNIEYVYEILFDLRK